MPKNIPQGSNHPNQDDNNLQRKPSGERQQEQSTGSPGSRQQGQNQPGQQNNEAGRQQGESSNTQRSPKSQH